MISSLDDAVPFFNKWKESGTSLHIGIESPALTVIARGKISPRSGREILELCDLDSGFVVRVRLTEALRFEYADPLSESPDVRHDAEEMGLLQCWEVLLPASRILLGESNPR